MFDTRARNKEGDKGKKRTQLQRQATSFKKGSKNIDTRPQNEGEKIRTKETKRRHEKQKKKNKLLAHCVNYMYLSVVFKLDGSSPIEFI